MNAGLCQWSQLVFSWSPPRIPRTTWRNEEEAKICPSFFNFKEVQQFVGKEGLIYFAFDQGQTGHRRRKPTGIVTNLPEMSQLAGLRGGGVTTAIHGGLGERILGIKAMGGMESRFGGCGQGVPQDVSGHVGCPWS